MEDNKPNAYPGKHIRIHNKVYTLAESTIPKGCKDCSFEHTYGCYKFLENRTNTPVTDYCRQGFILKRDVQ